MSDVNTENTQSGWTSAALLGGSLIAAAYVLPVVLPVIFGHLIASAVVAGGAAAYVASSESRRDKAKSWFSKIGKAYKDAFSNLGSGWKKATHWAEEKQAAAAAAAAAPEAGGASPLASKEAGSDFNATGAKVTVTHKAPAPAAKPAPGPGM